MMRVRIVGVGSPCGDDRIGWDAVAAIRERGLACDHCALALETCCCGPPAALFALFREVDAVIVVDAMKSGAPVGTVRKLAPDELAGKPCPLSSHGLGVAQCIELARTLGILPPTLAVYGIEAGQARPGTEPGRGVLRGIPALLRAVAADLDSLAAGGK